MRIAVFANGFDSGGSGIAHSLMAGARALARRGHALLLGIPRDEGFDGAEPSEVAEGVEIVGLASLPVGADVGGRLVVPTGVAALHCRAWTPDLVHAHGPFGAGLEAMAAARLLRVPLIGTSHGTIGELMWRGRVALSSLTPAIHRYARWYYDQCRLLTSPSSAIVAAMQQAGVRVPARVMGHPLPLRLRPRAESHADRKRRLGLSGFSLLHVGRLDAERHVDEIIHAVPSLITRIPRLSLTIVGRGPEEAALRRLAERLQVMSHVRFAGHLTGERLIDAYGAGDIFMTMSRAGTPDLRILEAMASGLPVIGARARGLLERVDASCGILVEPGDTGALVDAILALHRDAARGSVLGAVGRARAARFLPEPLALEWEEVYAEVVSRHHHQERAAASRIAPQPTGAGS